MHTQLEKKLHAPEIAIPFSDMGCPMRAGQRPLSSSSHLHTRQAKHINLLHIFRSAVVTLYPQRTVATDMLHCSDADCWSVCRSSHPCTNPRDKHINLHDPAHCARCPLYLPRDSHLHPQRPGLRSATNPLQLQPACWTHHDHGVAGEVARPVIGLSAVFPVPGSPVVAKDIEQMQTSS